MHIILPHNHCDPVHLAKVQAEMVTLGAPTIRAICTDPGSLYVALEGSHRLRAAYALGLTPGIEEIEWSDTVTTDDVVPGAYQDTWTLEQLCDSSWERVSIEFSA